MEKDLIKRAVKRKKRVLRVRKSLRRNEPKTRLSVFKSNKHLAAQIIDDEKGITLGSFSTMTAEAKEKNLGKKSKDSAKLIGQKIAEFAKQKKISHVVLDRGRYKYHGLIAELANAARAGGLRF